MSFDKIYHNTLSQVDFSSADVLVVGDIMLDRYCQGSTDRVSPEAPVPVVLVKEQSTRVGGAGNVAVNISALGANASILSIIGSDEAGAQLITSLRQHKVDAHLLEDEKLTTTTKLRVLSQHQQLLRLDFEDNADDIDIAPLLEAYKEMLTHCGLVVLSDYGKGLIRDARLFIELATARNVRVLVDPKYRDFSLYTGAFLVTPNKKEFESFAGPCANQAQLEQKGMQVLEQFRLQNLLITQGDRGMTLLSKGQVPIHFPAVVKDVYDVTGAGDTVIASLAAGIASGVSLQDSVYLSCIAAGIVVGRVGTSFVTREDILNSEHVNSHKLSGSKLISEHELEFYVQYKKQQNQTVVMTNGCFDILHSGHIAYLEQAAKLGDVLIVAVNSDASVKQLKGNKRPINGLEERMAVLAGLSCVDKVVAFSEDTPQRLICQLHPDILVKGGDYKVEEIAGRDCVGEVRLIDFLEGKSTTETLKKIQQTLD